MNRSFFGGGETGRGDRQVYGGKGSEGVGTWARSDSYGGGRLWTALSVNRRTLNLIRN